MARLQVHHQIGPDQIHPIFCLGAGTDTDLSPLWEYWRNATTPCRFSVESRSGTTTLLGLWLIMRSHNVISFPSSHVFMSVKEKATPAKCTRSKMWQLPSKLTYADGNSCIGILYMRMYCSVA